MGFLDNSGDIILDAVLTDTGRARLARADGSFQITKFALGDDEINYGSYNKNHPSGSAYYDLDILQTPVFEAFTNNSSVLKFKLQSISRTNLLYLPILKINDSIGSNVAMQSAQQDYLIACTTEIETSLSEVDGLLQGVSITDSRYITIDQGLDTTEISPSFTIDSDLKETQYLIEIDNRLGSIRKGPTPASLSYIDDDNIASYYLSSTDTIFVNDIDVPSSGGPLTSTIKGPVGTRLQFAIRASLELNSSTFLFTQLGTTATISGVPCYAISTNIRVTGVTTGYSINIPVRFIKAQ